MKYLLFVFLSFTLYKGLEETYDFFYEKAFTSDTCKKAYMNALSDKHEAAPLSKRFACTQREMGLVGKLEYILMRPHFSLKSNDVKWYY
jgi:hypothetical protein